MTKKIELTLEGIEELRNELSERKGALRDKIRTELAEAIALKDLSENADYSAAKDAQSANEARIIELENILRNAKVTDSKYFKITYIDLSYTDTFQLVSPIEANPKEKKVSFASPLGKALVKAQIGDEITFLSETGKTLKIKIENIE